MKIDESQVNNLLKFLKTLVSGKDFVLEQAPDLAQQIVMYGIIKGILVMSLCSVLFALLNVFAFKATKDEQEEKWLLRLVAASSSVILLAPPFIIELQPTIMSIFAPKLYLIEYIKDLGV